MTGSAAAEHLALMARSGLMTHVAELQPPVTAASVARFRAEAAGQASNIMALSSGRFALCLGPGRRAIESSVAHRLVPIDPGTDAGGAGSTGQEAQGETSDDGVPRRIPPPSLRRRVEDAAGAARDRAEEARSRAAAGAAPEGGHSDAREPLGRGEVGRDDEGAGGGNGSAAHGGEERGASAAGSLGAAASPAGTATAFPAPPEDRPADADQTCTAPTVGAPVAGDSGGRQRADGAGGQSASVRRADIPVESSEDGHATYRTRPRGRMPGDTPSVSALAEGQLALAEGLGRLAEIIDASERRAKGTARTQAEALDRLAERIEAQTSRLDHRPDRGGTALGAALQAHDERAQDQVAALETRLSESVDAAHAAQAEAIAQIHGELRTLSAAQAEDAARITEGLATLRLGLRAVNDRLADLAGAGPVPRYASRPDSADASPGPAGAGGGHARSAAWRGAPPQPAAAAAAVAAPGGTLAPERGWTGETPASVLAQGMDGPTGTPRSLAIPGAQPGDPTAFDGAPGGPWPPEAPAPARIQGMSRAPDPRHVVAMRSAGTDRNATPGRDQVGPTVAAGASGAGGVAPPDRLLTTSGGGEDSGELRGAVQALLSRLDWLEAGASAVAERAGPPAVWRRSIREPETGPQSTA